MQVCLYVYFVWLVIDHMQGVILLVEEIPNNHLTYMKPCK